MNFIETHLLEELIVFENFFEAHGFKRIEGQVFGLLSLTTRPLSSEEISKTLNLSQGAISLTLKSLSQFGAIVSTDSKIDKRKVHTAKEDAFAIISSVFRQKHQLSIEEFRAMIDRVLKETGPSEIRSKRLQSMVAACVIAETVIEFVTQLPKLYSGHYEKIAKQLPRALEVLTTGQEIAGNVTSNIKNIFKEGFKYFGEGQNDNRKQ
jgi:DNA-binding transcriptional regulator GbsR (MarR family)